MGGVVLADTHGAGPGLAAKLLPSGGRDIPRLTSCSTSCSTSCPSSSGSTVNLSTSPSATLSTSSPERLTSNGSSAKSKKSCSPPKSRSQCAANDPADSLAGSFSFSFAPVAMPSQLGRSRDTGRGRRKTRWTSWASWASSTQIYHGGIALILAKTPLTDATTARSVSVALPLAPSAVTARSCRS